MPRALAKARSISSEQLVIGLVFAVILVLAGLAPAKSDTWWLIRVGHDIWQSGHVATVDQYSHTIDGQPWPNHEWLTDVLFYAAHAVGGMPGVTLLCASLILAAWFASWSLTSGRFELRLTVFVLALTSAAGAWALRPQLTTMVCLCVATWLLVKGRIWWLPPLFVLWANLHGAVVLGLLAIGAAGLVDTIRLRRVPLVLFGAGVLSAAATVATPLGFDLWRLLVAYGEGVRGEGIQEWMAPAFPPENLAFWAVAAALVASTAFRWRSLDPPTQRLVAVAFVLLPMALDARRNVALFLLIGVPALTAAVSASSGTPQPHRRADNTAGNAIVLGVATLAALSITVYVWSRPPARLNWTPLSPSTVTAVASCHGPLYNTYDDGGPLIWFVPSQRVFIDSRYDPYPTTLFDENRHVEANGAYRDLFQRYGIRCAVVGTSSPTDLTLRTDPEWTMTHSDAMHSVHVRK